MKMISTHVWMIRVAFLTSGIFGTYGINRGFRNTSRQGIMEYMTDKSRYDSHIIPGFNKDAATDVHIQITIHDVHSVSETNMDYSVDLFLRQFWRDEKLDFTTFNTTFDKLEIDPKRISNIWRPDTYFRNEKKAAIHSVTSTNELIHIYKNGTVIFSMRLAMTLTCPMALHKYPFDSQICFIQLQSFGYTMDNIDLFWREFEPVSINMDEIPQFYVSRDVTTSKLIFDHQTGHFSCLQAEIRIQRKIEYFLLEVFVPSLLLIILSWMSFWVDSSAVPARVTLGVTCVLTMTTQISGVRQTLPPVSYVKAIDVWMFICLLFVFATILEFAYVNVSKRSDRRRREMEIGLEAQLSVADKMYSKTAPCNTWINVPKLPCMKNQPSLTGDEKAKKVDIISRFLFPMLFGIFLVVFVLYYVFIPNPSAGIMDDTV